MRNNFQDSSRRNFIKKLAGSTAAVAVGSNVFGSQQGNNYFESLRRGPTGVLVNFYISLIVAGGMGTEDTKTALQVPGVKLVAACDLYDGRLKDAKTKWGQDIFTTRSYKE